VRIICKEGDKMAIREEDLRVRFGSGKIYTHEEFMKLKHSDESVRIELIDGEIYFMATPRFSHQRISGNLHGALWNYLKDKDCEVFAAPITVKLKNEKKHDTTVQPDLVVICDETKISDDLVCEGSPELVIEILSPSTAKMDKTIKLERYLENGAHEYWIIDPVDRIIQVFTLKNGDYVMKSYTDDDVITSVVLPDLGIPLPDIFPPEDTNDENNQQEEI